MPIEYRFQFFNIKHTESIDECLQKIKVHFKTTVFSHFDSHFCRSQMSCFIILIGTYKKTLDYLFLVKGPKTVTEQLHFTYTIGDITCYCHNQFVKSGENVLLSMTHKQMMIQLIHRQLR